MVYPEWWPQSSEKQMKRDGFGPMSDLVLSFHEASRLCARCGYKGILVRCIYLRGKAAAVTNNSFLRI